MNDSRRAVLSIVGCGLFVVGLLLFLAGTRSSGQSLETFRVMLSPDAASIIGAAIALLAIVELLLLLVWQHKRTTMKHP